MMEGKRASKIEEETEAEYQRMVRKQKEKNVHNPPKALGLDFKPGKIVAVSVGETLVEGIIRKGEAGVFIVDSRNMDGTYTPIICTEDTISFWN
jgi:hypothetical protein